MAASSHSPLPHSAPPCARARIRVQSAPFTEAEPRVSADVRLKSLARSYSLRETEMGGERERENHYTRHISQGQSSGRSF